MLITIVALSLAAQLVPSSTRRTVSPPQVTSDADGFRMAREVARRTSTSLGGMTPSRVIPKSEAARWRPVLDDEMRSGCGCCVPRGYRFRRSAAVDMDHDGATDLVELVTDGRSDAVRISYGSRAPARLLLRSSDRRWSDQGLFAAGRNGVLLNQPEVNAIVLSQRGGKVLAEFIGD